MIFTLLLWHIPSEIACTARITLFKCGTEMDSIANSSGLNMKMVKSHCWSKYGAAVVYLWVVLVAEDIQSTMSGDPDHLLSSPASCRGVWDVQHRGTVQTLQARNHKI